MCLVCTFLRVSIFLAEGDKTGEHDSATKPENPSKVKIVIVFCRMTFVITHGYLEHGKKNWLLRMKEQLLVHGDYNVIVLDWLPGSGPPYTQVRIKLNIVSIIEFLFMSNFRQLQTQDL